MIDVCQAAIDLAYTGKAAEAGRLLERAAADGDGRAAFLLGEWRLTGQFIRRDLALARDHYGQAAGLGMSEASPIHRALLASGAGESGRRWSDAIASLESAASSDSAARSQLALLKLMALTSEGLPKDVAKGATLSPDPAIARFPDFLSAAECDYLITLSLPQLQPAVVVHPETGALIHDAVRTATSVAFPFVREDPVIHAINQRIAAATGTTWEQGEPLQVLSYQPGQQYKLHSDALPSEPNQRVMTFLVTLNGEFEGGETDFPDVPLRFRGAVGEGLMFRNVTTAGQPHPRARHAGLPVTAGRKLILSKWIRARPLDLSGPPGRPL